jgi:fatty acid desaturase
MQHISKITINDPMLKERQLGAFDRFIMRFINDERDLPFIHLFLGLSAIILPVAVVLYGWFTWWLAVPYLIVLFAVLLGPYILMLHNICHRKLFKKEYEWMNNIIPWFLGPFFGETPETYYAHHICMHHTEGNLKDDLSSTMKYQRDSFWGFMHYFASFFFLGIYALSQYFVKKNRKEWMRNILVGEFSFFALVAVMCLVSVKATVVMFVIPFCMTRFLMMAGNWGQHAFVDATDPGNSYKNSITCINSRYNKTCFNDGYHIGHHVRPAMHWTDMPKEFQDNVSKYREQGAIVFRTIDFFAVWLFLMTKQYGTLASFYVDLDETPKTKDEVIALLKSRTKRIDAATIEQFSGQDYMRDLRRRKL